LVKAGYVEEGVKRDSLTGVPQGRLVSPILSNIYIHELDLFMDSLIKKYHDTRADITVPNKDYSKVTRRIQYLREKMAKVEDTNLKHELNKESRELRKLRQGITSRRIEGIRLRYVRYADDWLVGLVSPTGPELAEKIRSEIQSFLKDNLKLELSLEKTKITDLLHVKAFFLGFYIMVHKPKESGYTRALRFGVTRKTRISHNRI